MNAWASLHRTARHHCIGPAWRAQHHWLQTNSPFHTHATMLTLADMDSIMTIWTCTPVALNAQPTQEPAPAWPRVILHSIECDLSARANTDGVIKRGKAKPISKL